MGTPVTSLRIDEEVKQQARPILEELGLNLSSSVNVFLRAVVRNRGLPFDVQLAEQGAAPDSIDFVAEYLAPLMSPRNAINRIGATPSRMRSRLKKRNTTMNMNRRTVV